MKWLMAGLALLMTLTGVSAWQPAAAQAGDACAGRAAPPTGLSEGALEFGGETRRYLLYAPDSLDATRPYPVVFSLHGFASNARQQVGLSGWNDLADEHGFVVVYPQGTGLPARWNAGSLGFRNPGQADDVGFLRALAAELTEARCADPARLFINGMSNGGGMTYRMACEAADVFAAFGGVAGAYSERLECEPARPTPFLFFHGTADPIVPFEGGPGLPDVPAFVEAFAARTSCASVPEPLPATGSASGIRYQGCDGGAEIGLTIIEQGGHTWPGGASLPGFLVGETTQDISASALLWDFYQAHPLADSE
jgi:polyhydroxybutyrate depolymerase